MLHSLYSMQHLCSTATQSTATQSTAQHSRTQQPHQNPSVLHCSGTALTTCLPAAATLCRPLLDRIQNISKHAGCPAGSYYSGPFTCSACPKGSYCPGGPVTEGSVPEQLQCPEGMTTIGMRASTFVQCCKCRVRHDWLVWVQGTGVGGQQPCC